MQEGRRRRQGQEGRLPRRLRQMQEGWRRRQGQEGRLPRRLRQVQEGRRLRQGQEGRLPRRLRQVQEGWRQGQGQEGRRNALLIKPSTTRFPETAGNPGGFFLPSHGIGSISKMEL